MARTSLDEIKTPEMSNAEIFTVLKYLFNDRLDELNIESLDSKDLGVRKYFLISDFVKRIGDKELLDSAMRFLKQQGFDLKDGSTFINALRDAGGFSDADITRIEAHTIGIQIIFIVYRKLNIALNAQLKKIGTTAYPLPENMPKTRVKVTGRVIEDNEKEAHELYRGKLACLMKAYAESIPTSDGKDFLTGAVSAYEEIEAIQNDPGFFANEISFLAPIKENLARIEILSQAAEPEFDVFRNNGYKLWSYIMDNFVDPGYGRASDVGYFYQLMSTHEKKFVHRGKEYFLNWYNQHYNEEINRLKAFAPKSDSDRERQFSLALKQYNT